LVVFAWSKLNQASTQDLKHPLRISKAKTSRKARPASAWLAEASSDSSPKQVASRSGSREAATLPQRQPPKSPISIQPLDTTISLPAKMANLDLAAIYQAEGSERGTDDGSLQAYQPTREGENQTKTPTTLAIIFAVPQSVNVSGRQGRG
jgi:hypothetical protein